MQQLNKKLGELKTFNDNFSIEATGRRWKNFKLLQAHSKLTVAKHRAKPFIPQQFIRKIFPRDSIQSNGGLTFQLRCAFRSMCASYLSYFSNFCFLLEMKLSRFSVDVWKRKKNFSPQNEVGKLLEMKSWLMHSRQKLRAFRRQTRTVDDEVCSFFVCCRFEMKTCSAYRTIN